MPPRLLQEPGIPLSRRREIPRGKLRRRRVRLVNGDTIGVIAFLSNQLYQIVHKGADCRAYITETRWPTGYPIDLFHLLPLLGGLPLLLDCWGEGGLVTTR